MELITLIGKVFTDVCVRIKDVICSAWGWFWSGIVFVVTWVLGWMGDAREMTLYLVFVAVMLDLAWGIASSYKRGIFALSTGLTKTAIKFSVYLSFLMLTVLIEKSLSAEWDFIFRGVAAILIVSEAVSITAHMLIIKPDMPIIKLLFKFLSSEIAKKLGIDKSDIQEYINEQIKRQ